MAASNPAMLEKLADDITIAASQMSAYLKSLATSHEASLSTSTPLAGSLAIPPNAPLLILAAKTTLFEATTSIQQLISSPIDYQQSLTISNNFLACTRWLCTFDIPTHVPAPPASIGYTDLAAKANVPESQLTRIARMAMCAGQFYEPSPLHIAHTPLSLALRSPSPTLDTMLFLTEISAPSAMKMTEMTKLHLASSGTDTNSDSGERKTEKLAFNIALSTPLPFYAFLQANPTHAKRLASSMKSVSAADESHVRHLIHGFDWGSLAPGSRVVDMGGSTGHVSFALAAAFPELRYVVQDLKSVIDAQPPIPAQLQGKVVFQAHDFFEPQPQDNNDVSVYLIRQCLQNWPDDKATLILKQLLPSIRANTEAKVVIMNVILPNPGEEGVGQRGKAVTRFRDMLGMQALGAKERGLEEWRALVDGVGDEDGVGVLEVKGVERPVGSVLGVIVVGLR